MKQHPRNTSVLLAIVLQVMPVARQIVTQIADYVPNIGVFVRWGFGASALLGGVDAVSGASQGGGAVAPKIKTQPVSRTVDAGVTAKFSVAASGSRLSYQWRYDGVAIVGATGKTLTVPNVQVANAGNYSVIVGNPIGRVISQVATLTVNPVPSVGLLRPTFAGLIVDPAGAALESSGGFTLRVSPTGKLSGGLTMAGGRYLLHGQFDANGHVQVNIPRAGNSPLVATLQIDLAAGGHTVTGQVSDVTWQADVTGVRAPNLPVTLAGAYPITINDGTNSSTATITVGPTATTILSGSLPTGVTVKATTELTFDNQVPIFMPVSNDGAVIGWLGVSTNQVTGDLAWLHADGTISTLTVKSTP